jgi:hypothetical protein
MKTQSLGIVALIASLPWASAADLTGKVVLKGTPKAEISIDMAPDPKCAALHTTPITTRHYMVDKDGGLANVLVFVKSGLTEKNFPTPSEPAVLDQTGCEYSPYVMGVMVNQKIKIKNSDPTLHNVHAVPKPGTANKEFNIAQPVKDMVSEKSFPAPEVPLQLKCDVHPWMLAYVGVFEHPFFAVTDKEGNYKISGLPNGKYTVEAYHQKTHRANPGVPQEIAVDGNKKVDFTIEIK